MAMTVCLPSDLEQTLRERASENGLDVAAFIVEALRQHVAHPAEAERRGRTDNGDEAETEPVWRGVFPTEPARREVFSEAIDVTPGTLPRWQPDIVLNPDWFADDE